MICEACYSYGYQGTANTTCSYSIKELHIHSINDLINIVDCLILFFGENISRLPTIDIEVLWAER